jgi:hypothetical protein
MQIMANAVRKKRRAEGVGVGRHHPCHPTVATDGVSTPSSSGSWRPWRELRDVERRVWSGEEANG